MAAARPVLVQTDNSGEPGQPSEPQDPQYIPDSVVDENGEPL